jgi:hypothetical protein
MNRLNGMNIAATSELMVRSVVLSDGCAETGLDNHFSSTASMLLAEIMVAAPEKHHHQMQWRY